MTTVQIVIWIASVIVFYVAGWYQGVRSGYTIGREACITAMTNLIDKGTEGVDDDEITLKLSKNAIRKECDTVGLASVKTDDDEDNV